MAFNDLTGQKFGKLTVLYRAEDHLSKNGNKRVVWHCMCDCGNETDVMALNLTRNHTLSCGCARDAGRKPLIRDITGQRFGQLVAIQRVENASRTKWLFRCDCGNEVEAYLTNVVSGKTKSCGKKCGLKNHPYENKETLGFRGDLTGQRFGRLLVLEQLDDREKYTQFRCQCDCGRETVTSGSNLKYGITKSCGCLHKDLSGKSNAENLIGKRFGKLVVIGKAPTKYDKLHWLCLCDCGKETVASTSGLKSGHTQSCGCYQDEVASDTHFVDLTGRRFGRLTVLERADNSRTGLVRYLCKCDCGKTTTVSGAPLVDGRTQSCGCWKYSRLEESVIQYFEDNGRVIGIDYETQKRYDGLVGTGGSLLSFDFVVYKNKKLFCFIECQGQQHYNPIEYWGGAEKFEQQKEHDKRKKEFAVKMNVPLLEIPYTYTNEEIVSFLIDKGI